MSLIKNIKHDFPASIVVFFVALPLCLGIALASGAPLFSGVIAGIIGGIIVGALSGSPLGVSGPAAGLAVIVFNAIETLGSWPAFLLTVVLAGGIQLAMGYARIGFIAYFFPSSVINGMLSGIGILIILKQIPHLLGYDKSFFGDFSFFQFNGDTTLSALSHVVDTLTSGPAIIGMISLGLLLLWDYILSPRHKLFRIIPSPIVVIVFAILLNTLFSWYAVGLGITSEHLVRLPVTTNIHEFINQFYWPDFSLITHIEIWKISIIIAIVASLETLLCVEATDKLDPHKRITPTNRELKAQGVGNILSGLCGGLPVTQVIVRSSANIAFGAQTKLSACLHGFFLLISAATIPQLLNMIPISSLAAILIIVGYKLAKPVLFKKMYLTGQEQFIPFIGTIIGILSMDLLMGISFGMCLGIFYTLRNSYRNDFHMTTHKGKNAKTLLYRLTLAEEVSFFNKASIIRALKTIPDHSSVVIDCQNSKFIAYDIKELINDYKNNAKLNVIDLNIIGLDFTSSDLQ